MSEETTGAISGAVTGAETGAIFGPAGIVVGAILGGLGGLLGGGKARKARLAMQRAQGYQRQQKLMAVGIQRRNLVREAITAHGMQAASAAMEDGGMESSGYIGAAASARTQFAANLKYFDTQTALGVMADTEMAKAGKYQQQAQDIFGGLNTAASLVSFAGPKIQAWNTARQDAAITKSATHTFDSIPITVSG